MPAVLRGRADEAPTYITTSATYISVLSMLCKPAEAANLRVMKYTSFVSLWHDRCPSIKFMKPREDLWVHCEQLRAQCKTAASEEARTQTLSAGTSHTELARVERQVYHKKRAVKLLRTKGIPYRTRILHSILLRTLLFCIKPANLVWSA